MYRIDVDSARALVTVDVAGFWTVDTIGPFARDLGAAVRRLNATDRHALVVGFDEADIAPGPVIEALRHLVVAGPTRARRMALYTASALKRLQVKRIADAREMAMVFTTRQEAEDWACARDSLA